jgi:NADP-dependent 3-hydroxy acid dehydrogenase YdfG
MHDFADKVVVITGAASGIGRALAHNFAARGARLALADWNAEGLAATVRALSTTQVFSQQVDVGQRDQVFAFREAVVAEFGTVDAVFNNAGVAVSQRIAELSYDDFEWIVAINFWGVVHGTKAFLPDLLQRREALLVNTSSVFGLIAVPTQGAYNATKFAVRGFTEALRHELAGGPVHVMCVHPGGVRTDIARNARLHEAPDGATDKPASVRQFDRLARTTPEAAAAAIVRAAQRRRGRCLIGADAHAIDWLARLLPANYWALLGRLMPSRHRRAGPLAGEK